MSHEVIITSYDNLDDFKLKTDIYFQCIKIILIIIEVHILFELLIRVPLVVVFYDTKYVHD